MLQSVRTYEGPGSLVSFEFSQVPRLYARRHGFPYFIFFPFSFPEAWRGENPITTNRSGPTYAIFGPLAAMIRCQTCEFSCEILSLSPPRLIVFVHIGRIILREFGDVKSLFAQALSLSSYFFLFLPRTRIENFFISFVRESAIVRPLSRNERCNGKKSIRKILISLQYYNMDEVL